MQSGGTSQISCNSLGSLSIGKSQTTYATISAGTDGYKSIVLCGSGSNGIIGVRNTGSVEGLIARGTSAIGWHNSSDIGTSSTSADSVLLWRDTGNTLAQRNSTNAQTYRLYNTLTGSDVSATGNYERGFLKWDSNIFKIGTEAGTGGGSARSLEIELNGSTRAIFGGGSSLTIPGVVSTVFIDCNTYFGSTTVSNSRALAGNGFAVGSAYTYGFSSTTGANGTQDVALARDSAGVVKITDGSTGTGYLRQEPIPVGNLPTAAAGNAGTRIFVSDSNVGAIGNFGEPVASGGSNVVPVYSDGTDWRIG